MDEYEEFPGEFSGSKYNARINFYSSLDEESAARHEVGNITLQDENGNTLFEYELLFYFNGRYRIGSSSGDYVTLDSSDPSRITLYLNGKSVDHITMTLAYKY